MINGLEHVGTDHKCSICQCDFTDDEGGIQGYLGILPVAFCPFCFAGIDDMMQQLNEREWEDLTDEEVASFDCYAVVDAECVRAIEAKIKEKNSD
jgi:hypothetical protein